MSNPFDSYGQIRETKHASAIAAEKRTHQNRELTYHELKDMVKEVLEHFRTSVLSKYSSSPIGLTDRFENEPFPYFKNPIWELRDNGVNENGHIYVRVELSYTNEGKAREFGVMAAGYYALGDHPKHIDVAPTRDGLVQGLKDLFSVFL